MASAQAVVRAFVEKEGPIRRILDLTAVETIAIPDSVAVHRAKTQPVTTDNTVARVMVAPTDFLFARCRQFAAFQETQGVAQPPIVRSRALAYAELGLSDPDFQPI